MDVNDMLDAALADLDAGEVVTTPSLPDIELWNALTAASMALGPNLSAKTTCTTLRNIGANRIALNKFVVIHHEFASLRINPSLDSSPVKQLAYAACLIGSMPAQ